MIKSKVKTIRIRKQQPLFFCLLLSGILFLNACTNHSDITQTKSIFYLVQPAEHFPAFNGHLNWYGRLRAGDLMRFLKDSGVQKIYSTSFSRALETVDSLQTLQKSDVIEYDIDSTAGNIFKLLRQKEDFGKKVLIVCPSADLNAVAEKLGARLPENYDVKNKFNIIYRIVNDHGQARITRQEFGRAPRPVVDTAADH